MFSLPHPLLAQWEAVPVSPTILILLESKQKLVSSGFHVGLEEMLFVTSLKIFRNYEWVITLFSACFDA